MRATLVPSDTGGETHSVGVVVNDDPAEFEIRPTADRLPGLFFVPVSEPKTTKNRLHLDFRPDDRDAEVERLLAAGSHASGRRTRRADLDCSWRP